MKSIFLLLLFTIVYASTPDSCINCHKDTSPIDNYHPYNEFGCFSCHGGDKLATNKILAHKDMVLNPSRLEHAPMFCGKCHEEIIDRVQGSIMNSMSGVLDVLKYQFHETKTIEQTDGIQSLKNKPTNQQSLAENHFSKMCAACHVNQEESIFKKNGYVERGGGCVDCHRVDHVKKLGIKNEKLKLKHPKFSTKIPSKNCLKCHNRSNRIGLSYFGQFESEGYGTPYKKGKLTHKIDKGRYYYDLPSDIHHQSGKLDCIDCHTEAGVMGDGKKHKHMEDSVDISCKDCHKPNFVPLSDSPLANMLIALNGNMPFSTSIAISERKKSPIYNLQKEDDKIKFYRKKDGKLLDLTTMKDSSYHTLDIHKRLDCTACHSSWIPSCYGCHEVYFKNGKQYDWIKHKKTKGKWMELRSYLRYESPALAIGYNEKIMPTAPGCQVITSIYDKNITDEGFHSFAYAAWDPHTTSKTSRSCIDCHFNPQTLGLGAGILDINHSTVTFTPFYDSNASGLPIGYPIDSLVSKEGKQFQTFSRDKARGFNQNEINKITSAYKCILCHDKWDDKIYIDFKKSKNLFYNKKTICAKKVLK